MPLASPIRPHFHRTDHELIVDRLRGDAVTRQPPSNLMSDYIISIENLGKKYALRHATTTARYTALRDVITNKVGALFRPAKQEIARSEDFWALKDVSFEVKQGEVLGIIGRNGAGKSTLLKILSRITEPTRGRVTLRGRVSSLLEVGTGFHPELTGRENIYLNGAILGMTISEIRSKFDEIVAFAEIERFLDTPVKHYSSGMHVRLAFAVAAHLEPEVLIVDEVLAVGDAEFQKRCLGKMQDVAQSGRTVLFVSHQLNVISTLCRRCILLEAGSKKLDGPTNDVIAAYLSSTESVVSEWKGIATAALADASFSVTRFALVDEELQSLKQDIPGHSKFGVLIEGVIEEPTPLLTLGYAIYADNGQLLWWSLQTDTAEQCWPVLSRGPNRFISWIPQNMLNEGSYRFELIVSIHWSKWISQPMLTPLLFRSK